MNTTTELQIEAVSTKKMIEGIEYVSVMGRWIVEGIDRNETHGICFANTKSGNALANRLARAIRAGVVFTNPEVKTDINGKTYLESKCNVMGKYANSDLKRLGF